MRILVWNRPPTHTTVTTRTIAWHLSVPDRCFIEACKRPIRSAFVFGQTQAGARGAMCLGCHRTLGCGLGEWEGVVYSRRHTDGQFVGKVQERRRL